MAEQDWGYILATMAHLYHMGPQEVLNLTDAQLTMYIENSGAIRLQRDMPQLSANFGQMDQEARQKLIDEADLPPDQNSVHARAWRIFVRNYQTASEEAEAVEAISPLTTLSPEAAEGIVKWWNPGGGLYNLPEGSAIWSEYLAPIHRQLIARASELKGS